jgi:hypothetical protein
VVQFNFNAASMWSRPEPVLSQSKDVGPPTFRLNCLSDNEQKEEAQPMAEMGDRQWQGDFALED